MLTVWWKKKKRSKLRSLICGRRGKLPLPVSFPDCTVYRARFSPSVHGPVPPPCLHHGNDIYKWSSASHRHGVTASRSTPACGGDGNSTEVSPVPRLGSEPCRAVPEGTRAAFQGRGEVGQSRAAAVPPFGPAVAKLLPGEPLPQRLPLEGLTPNPAGWGCCAARRGERWGEHPPSAGARIRL